MVFSLGEDASDAHGSRSENYLSHFHKKEGSFTTLKYLANNSPNSSTWL